MLWNVYIALKVYIADASQLKPLLTPQCSQSLEDTHLV